MFGIGFFELVVIAVVAIIFVGPDRLPEFMRKAGRLFVQARRVSNEVKSSFNQAIYEVEEEIRKEKAAALKILLDEHRQEQALVKPSESAVEKHASSPDGAEPTEPQYPKAPDLVSQETTSNNQAAPSQPDDGKTVAKI